MADKWGPRLPPILRFHGSMRRGLVGTFFLRLATTLLSFLPSIALARLLGAEQYGIYAYIMALIALLSIPSQLGLPQLCLRQVAAYQVRSSWSKLRGILSWANKLVAYLSCFLIAVSGMAAWTLANRYDTGTLITFGLGLMLIPLRALSALRSATLRGLGYVIVGQFPEALLRPAVFLLLLLVFFAVLENQLHTSSLAMGLHLAATALSFAVGGWLLWKRLPEAVMQHAPEYESGTWLRSGTTFFFAAGLRSVSDQVPILLLGPLVGVDAVAIFLVATRGANLVSLILTVVNMVVGPTFAKLYAAGNLRKLQHVVTLSARLILGLSAPLALILIVFNRPILELLFGPEFVAGASALSILCVGELVNAATGSVGLLLNMTGHEKDSLRANAIAAVVNIVLCLSLIPQWGIEGAAVAFASSRVTANLLLSVWAFSRLQIHATALGRIFPLKDSGSI